VPISLTPLLLKGELSGLYLVIFASFITPITLRDHDCVMEDKSGYLVSVSSSCGCKGFRCEWQLQICHVNFG
jgi:hypothetical protein